MSRGVDWHEVESREAWVVLAEGYGIFVELLGPVVFENVDK